MNVAIIPPHDEFWNNKLFHIDNGRDNSLERYVLLRKELLSKGHKIETIDKYIDLKIIDLIIFQTLSFAYLWLLKCIKANPNVLIINYATEPTIISSLNSKSILDSQMFDAVLTWNDDYLTDDKYISTRAFSFIQPIKTPNNFKNKRHLCLINYYKNSKHVGAIYSERDKILNYFGPLGKIDLFGYGWDKHKNQNIRQIYKGPVRSKVDTLINYKFSVAFENVNNEKGYICEKIFDSFSAYSIPIFYGAPNVKDLIPEDTFIDYRDFNSLDELNVYLDSINEEKYNKYLSSIKKFVASDEYLKFTSKGFVASVSRAIVYVTNKSSQKKSVTSLKLEFIKNVFRYPKSFWNAKRFYYNLIMHK